MRDEKSQLNSEGGSTRTTLFGFGVRCDFKAGANKFVLMIDSATSKKIYWVAIYDNFDAFFFDNSANKKGEEDGDKIEDGNNIFFTKMSELHLA